MDKASDEITLSGMVFFGRHGVNPEETALGQRFGVDLTVFMDLTRAGVTDEVADTVSYAALYKLVRAEVEGKPSALLEHLAARIMLKIIGHDERIRGARLRVTKLNPPLKESASGQASITIERDRAWLQ